MSNFQCDACGMVNIDCGQHGYKTPREIIYEEALDKIDDIVSGDYETLDPLAKQQIFNIIKEVKSKLS